MIGNLVLHPHTKEQVAQFIGRPGQALLLIGSNGVGKRCLAEVIATAVLQLESGKLAQHPYYTALESEKNSISIDAIRQLQHFLQLKTLGSQPLRRAVIVEHAETLTTEAQNAYLKLLEEPPADTLMILTADNPRALLPTILSRVQAITVYAPGEEVIKAHFAANSQDGAAVNQAYFLSGGLPGLMHALLAGDQTHPLLAGVAQAKEILQKQTFERLAMVESLSKQKDAAKYVIEALQHIAQTGLDQSAKRGDPEKLHQWHRILKVASRAGDALGQNANTKLVLSDLMLHI
jgi:DNA polymerase III subunit delta'